MVDVNGRLCHLPDFYGLDLQRGAMIISASASSLSKKVSYHAKLSAYSCCRPTVPLGRFVPVCVRPIELCIASIYLYEQREIFIPRCLVELLHPVPSVFLGTQNPKACWFPSSARNIVELCMYQVTHACVTPMTSFRAPSMASA